MSLKILSSLSASLSNVYQILETIVFRTNEGAIFTVEIGESAMTSEGNTLGAKVTLKTIPEMHIGICEGKTIEQVSTAAQELISSAILSGKAIAPQASIPKPHISFEPKVHA